MNKSQLIDAIAAKTGQSKAAVTAIVNAATEVVQDAVAKGDKVSVPGTALDGGPVVYHCGQCRHGVHAADLDVEHHAPPRRVEVMA